MEFRKRQTQGVFVLCLALIFIFSLSSCTSKDSDGNTFSVAVNANIKGLDPVTAGDTYMHLAISQLYEGLLSYHHLKRPLELVPALAESMPKVTKNGQHYEFKIKKGVFFHDNKCFEKNGGKGRELKAQDFIYSWKRVADPIVRSNGFWVFDGKIKGLNEWRDNVSQNKADYSTPVEGLKAPDDYTLVVELTKPYHQFLYTLTMTYAMVVPQECAEFYGEEFQNNPVGTGPFLMKNWVRNNKLELVKNENWRGETYPSEGEAGDKKLGLLEDAGKKIPFVDKVTIFEILEDQPLWLNFMKGNTDLSGIPKDSFDQAVVEGELKKELKDKGILLKKSVSPDVTYIGFNMKDKVLGKNKYLRQAMTLAYDVPTVIEKMYNGRALNAQSPIPPGIDSYDPNYKNPYKGPDLEKAKALMKKAGFPNGKGLPTFMFDSTSSSTARQFAEFFKIRMSKIGINIKIKTNTWPEFQKRIREKKVQIFGMAWMGDYPDAQNFYQLFYGPNQSPGPNNVNFDNPKFNKLYRQALALPIGPKRTQIYHQLRDIVTEESPWIISAHRIGYSLNHGWVNNLKRHQMISDYIKYVRINEDVKEKLKKKL